MTPSVLICGAGVAGTTAAYFLARRGYRVTVVERAAGQRSSGNPVDVRGPATAVARDMGVLAALRERATHATRMRVVDAAGRTVARLPMQAGADAIEIPRSDLASVLSGAAREHAEFRYDDTITAIAPDASGVDVTFDRAAPQRFDLVVGADGLHSAVRRLAFDATVRHLGVWVATLPLQEPAAVPDEVLLYNEPGRLLSVHPSRGEALLAFIFRGPDIPGLDHRDTERHRRIVADAYAGAGWEVPRLLPKLWSTEPYFDSVSRVHLPTWSQGRVTLVGDAASCVSLFGDGSSLAMAGAFTLAESLGEALAATGDPASALRRYEAVHRTRTDPKVRHAGRSAALVVPRTRLGLAARNATARLLTRR